ncbi:MAG TPA: LptF/LptG family permease [Candidatus Kapabacteria bacterium]|nr:LptF/LptG family permease [Candidatus Kapabacteria bacterium]
MFDRLDRYIVRQFILTFLFGMLAFIVIYVAVDLMEHLGDFFDHKVPTMVIVQFYLYQVPDIVHLIVPISTLLGSLFTIGRLDTTHELTAMRASGRSMRRVALPLLLCGLVISGGMVYFDGWLVPISNKRHFAINRQYLGQDLITGQRNVFLRISANVNLLMDYFDPAKADAHLVSIERFDTAARIPISKLQRTSPSAYGFTVDTATTLKITERIDASVMHYDSVKKIWVLIGGISRNLQDPDKVVATSFDRRELPSLPITPQELNLSQENINELSVEEFRERIEQEQLGGRDVRHLWVDYYSKFSFPFSAMIVIFFGIPFSSGQRKSGAAVQIAITALVSAIYLVLTEISKTLSYGDAVPPVTVAWLVNVLFLLVGSANLFRVERG